MFHNLCVHLYINKALTAEKSEEDHCILISLWYEMDAYEPRGKI